MIRPTYQLRNKDLVTACGRLVTDDPVRQEFFKRQLFARRHSPDWFRLPLTQAQYQAKLDAFKAVVPDLVNWLAERCSRCQEQLAVIRDELHHGLT